MEQAHDRRTVLACLFCFDIVTFLVRSLQLLTNKIRHRSWTTLVPQMVNMSMLWAVIYCINQRSRKSYGKPSAALQVQASPLSPTNISQGLFPTLKALALLSASGTGCEERAREAHVCLLSRICIFTFR